jgi:hypothetical protein
VVLPTHVHAVVADGEIEADGVGGLDFFKEFSYMDGDVPAGFL